MSLTKLLSANTLLTHQIPIAKSELVDINGRQVTSNWWKQSIRVPSIGNPPETSRLGTAFDYLARAILENKVGTVHAHRGPWVAKQGLVLLLHALGIADDLIEQGVAVTPVAANSPSPSATMLLAQWKRAGTVFRPVEVTDAKTSNHALIQERRDGWKLACQHNSAIYEVLVKNWREAVDMHDRFVLGNASVEQYAHSALFLASLEVVWRSRSVDVLDVAFKHIQSGRHSPGALFFSQNATLSEEQLVQNLVALSEVFQRAISSWAIANICCNPVFGKHSNVVGGADADVICDETLIDFKTQNKLVWRSKDWAQLCGYASFALDLGWPIRRIGIYYGRFGVPVFWEVTPQRVVLLDNYRQLIYEVASRK